MPLEHDDAPRFTPERRDAILNLAARLQAEHEATVSANELARAAAEAGIAPRFVAEAARRVGRRSHSAPGFRGPVLAFVLLALQAVFVTAFFHRAARFDDVDAYSGTLVLGVAVAALLSLWAARNRPIRRFVPLVALATWIIVGFVAYVVESQLIGEYGYGWVFPTMVRFGLTETFAAVVAVLATVVVEREPRRSLRGTRA